MAKRKKGKGKSKRKSPKPKPGPASTKSSETAQESAADASRDESDETASEPGASKATSSKPKPDSKSGSGGSDGGDKTPAAKKPRGPIATIDAILGKIELGLAAFFLISLTLLATYQFIRVTLLKGNLEWADIYIRYLVFFTAMSAAAFAAQQRRMMAIDFVPRLLKPKVRAISRIVIALFVTFVSWLLAYVGHLNRVSELKKVDVEAFITPPTAMLALPIGAGLIGLHFLLQAIIDGGYLIRGEVPPEPEAAVH